MAELYTFSVPNESKQEVKKILAEKRKNQQGSAWITQAILEKYQRENYKLIDDFQQPQLELDFLPRVYEPLTMDHLKQLEDLDPKQVGRMRKMAYWNLKVVNDYIDGVNRKWAYGLRDGVSEK